MKLITIDIEKCTGCRMCELSCGFNKEKKIVPHLSRINVFSNWRLGLSIPVVCFQCTDALCIKSCPTGALYRDKVTGAVIVDEKLCIGCRICSVICPFGGVVYSAEKKKILKCDLCSGEPVCVKFCPTGAIKFEEPTNYSVGKRREIAEIALKYIKAQVS
ncbi:MAG: 4Fe-4S dicluster domain-containing protein [Elusimicrobiota bacterium]|nr:4Fe-4S dicluster domain-containing protein [Elusimicrobiota bacterium]